MRLRFKKDKLRRLFEDAGFAAGLPPEVVQGFRRRIVQIQAVSDEQDLRNLKSLRYEKSKGRRAHQHSIRINAQWRLILEREKDEKGRLIIVIDIEDYH